MGAKADRMKRMKVEHPTCYFCGVRDTETEDHVPSRECFRGRVGPEGFSFPACRVCNNSAGQIEQVVALYLHLANHDEIPTPVEQLRRLASGVHNNNRDLLPIVEINAKLARKHFRVKGLVRPAGQAFGETPIATLPHGHCAAMDTFGRRLIAALFYKELGYPIPLDFYMATIWLPWTESSSSRGVIDAIDLFPEMRLTNRRNTDIGDQFTYKWGAHEDGSVFGFVAQFSKSYFFIGAAAAPNLHPQGDAVHEQWRVHHSDIASLHVPKI